MPAVRPARIRTALPLDAVAGAGGEARIGPLTLPKRLKVLPWGESRSLDGSAVIVNDKTLSVFEANQKKLGAGEVALDFGHNTFAVDQKGKRVKVQEPVAVAGYGPLSIVKDDGIYYTPLSWTDDGEKFYTGGHYRDLSGVPLRDEEGVVIAMESVALCRMGQIEGMHAFSADHTKALSATLFPESSDDDAKSETNETTMDPLKKMLLELLGLAETATDEEVTAAFAAKKKEPSAAVEGEPTALEARFDAFERTQLLQGAAAAGKAIPLSAEAVAVLPLATLRTVIDGLPAGAVPLQANTVLADGKAAPKALSADQLKIAQTLGISPEDWRKHNPED